MPLILNKRTGRIPEGAVLIDRTTPYGNFAHTVRYHTVGQHLIAVQRFLASLMEKPELVRQAMEELAGRDLVCWCRPLPCHGDVWMAIVNKPVIRIPLCSQCKGPVEVHHGPVLGWLHVWFSCGRCNIRYPESGLFAILSMYEGR